jgi:hypothetical protein
MLIRLLGLPTLTFGLTGCGAALEKWENTNSFMVAANPLCEETPGYEVDVGGACKPVPPAAQTGQVPNPQNTQKNPNKVYLGTVVNESEYFCGKFLNGLVLAENSSNVGLDVLTTVFSALGTAFTPIATIHALTAAVSISSGTKTAIDSDIYARATIGNYAQAIQSSYYADMKTYVDELTTANEDDLIPSIEVSKIRTIHKECSLASAQATISATLQSSPTGTSTIATQTVTVIGSSGTFTITATASSLSTPISVTYTATKGDTAASIATKLSLGINNDQKFQSAGKRASAVIGVPTSFALRAPTAAGIKWTVSGQLSLGAQTQTAPAAAPSAAPAPVPIGTTSGTVPGHALRC